jgi:hypothetical protein
MNNQPLKQSSPLWKKAEETELKALVNNDCWKPVVKADDLLRAAAVAGIQIRTEDIVRAFVGEVGENACSKAKAKKILTQQKKFNDK